MSFDNSRFPFNPRNDYFGVVMEQGRVQLDSDWNEWLAELRRRIQAETLDILGRAVYPATTPFAFQITASNSGGTNSISIGPGRMYVDGLLAENHGAPASAQWDPALAEMSGSPQPPPSSETDAVDFTNQPYLPNAAIPSGNGPFLAFLDVWTRAVTFLEDPNLVDKAVGVDTTGRLQTVWQVKLMSVPSGTTCSGPFSFPADSAGQLTTGTVSTGPSGPCCLTDSTGYTGLENQFYRVEIHKPGVLAADNTYPLPAGSPTATFKWSRDNASVATLVTGIAGVTNSLGNPASQLTVQSMGRDQVLGFAPGNWIEIIDDDLELNGQPGELHQIDSIDFASKTITLDHTVSAANFPVDSNDQTTPSRHTRIQRWDMSGKVYEKDKTTVWVDLDAAGSTGDIPVPPAGTTLILENGITVTFGVSPSTGSFNTGDFWTFAARTADGSVEQLTQAPPRGIHHHYAPLSIVTFSPLGATDCRTEWPPTAAPPCGCCCTVTVGDGVNSVGKFTSIQAAINSLPAAGGEVCILAGRYFEHVFIQNRSNVVIHGCGWQTRIASPSLQPGGSTSSSGGGAGSGSGSSGSGGGTGGAGSGSGSGGAGPASTDTFNAVISVGASQHIELRSFAVEADTDEVGILIDGTGVLIPPTASTGASGSSTGTSGSAGSAGGGSGSTGGSTGLAGAGTGVSGPSGAPGIIVTTATVMDVTIEDTVIAASTRPAILAKRARLLRIEDNRIAMQNVESTWPAVYTSGTEIHIERNWVSIQTPFSLAEWFPSTVSGDLAAAAQAAKAAQGATPSPNTPPANTPTAGPGTPNTATSGNASPKVAAAARAALLSFQFDHPGGIQIAGPSTDVFVIENEIEGGSRNGITLGSLGILDANGNETNQTIGVLLVAEDPCATTGTLQTPGTNPGPGGGKVAAGGALVTIRIERNRIRNMGLCGIGPVGFFDLTQTHEVITIADLNITDNEILSTLQRPVAQAGAAGQQASIFGYGAICVPDVVDLMIRDNTILNFGAIPGDDVCGIFILLGETVEVSRNQVVESRDWIPFEGGPEASPSAPRGGIWAAFVTPPAFTSTSTLTAISSTTIYQPGLPALRVEGNTVRVPLAQSLAAIGIGPFAISNNHLGCGGAVSDTSFQLAETVFILNFGVALEATTTTSTPSGLFNNTREEFSRLNQSVPFYPSSGAVLFTNNICQYEARAIEQLSFASVFILSLDHLIFANNHCWLDGQTLSAIMDAFLLAGSLQVTSNRFQEAANSPVLLSGMTLGSMNITSQNISTYCLVAKGNTLINNNNLSVIQTIDENACQQFGQ